MVKKFLRYIKRFFYALPFAMKGGDILTANSDSDNNSMSVNQQVQTNRLSEALLKGEVNQQVEELRYRNYKVAEESKNYQYLGEGVAVKKERNNIHSKVIRFVQRNSLVVEGILEELKRIDKNEYGKDRYTLNVIYDDIPRFKLEKYCTVFEVAYDSEEPKYSEIKLHFDNLPDTYDSTSKMFLNEVRRIKDNNLIYKNNFSRLNKLSFVTFKTDGERDLINYTFDGLNLYSIDENGMEYIFCFKVEHVTREDLTDKFHSDTMEQKYATKEKKEVSLTLSNDKEKKYCSVCGKEMNEYDSQITELTYGKPICIECIEKDLLSEKK